MSEKIKNIGKIEIGLVKSCYGRGKPGNMELIFNRKIL